MENYILYQEICKTKYHTVHKARKIRTINYLAVSCIEKIWQDSLNNHVRIIQEIHHPSILKFYEWYETSCHLWIVMELFSSGNLEQVLHEDNGLPERLVNKFGIQLLYALDYLHSVNILFIDWRPSQILINNIGRLKLFDFTYARVLDSRRDQISNKKIINNELSETNLPFNCFLFMPPEIFNGQMPSFSTDIWAFGCLMFRMSHGYNPFSGDSFEELSRNIQCLILTSLTLEENLLLRNLLECMLEKVLNTRIKMAELIRHDFWRSFYNAVINQTDNVVFCKNTAFSKERALTEINIKEDHKVSCSIDQSINFILHANKSRITQAYSTVKDNINYRLDNEKHDIFFDKFFIRDRVDLSKQYPWASPSTSFPFVSLAGGSNLTEPNKYSLSYNCNIFWIPRALDDYLKWARSSPRPNLIDILIDHYPDISFFNSQSTNRIDEDHLKLLHKLFSSQIELEQLKISLISYATWIIALTTLDDSIGLAFIPIFLLELTHQMESFIKNIAISSMEFCIWQNRFMSLLMYRSSRLILSTLNNFKKNNNSLKFDYDNTLQFIIKLIACVSPALEILFRAYYDQSKNIKWMNQPRFRYALITVIGETFICTLCILVAFKAGLMDSILQTAWPDISEELWSKSIEIMLNLANNPDEREFCQDFLSPLNKRRTVSLSTCRILASKATEQIIFLTSNCKLLDGLYYPQENSCSSLHPKSKIKSYEKSIISLCRVYLRANVVRNIWKSGIEPYAKYTEALKELSSHNSIPASKKETELESKMQVCILSLNSIIGLIFYQPNLFITGILENFGFNALIQLFEAANLYGNKSNSIIQARLLSLIALGLNIQKECYEKQTIVFENTSRNFHFELLYSEEFHGQILLGLESPHPMNRAKAYLVIGHLLTVVPETAFPLACSRRLPGMLARDSTTHSNSNVQDLTPDSNTSCYLYECAKHIQYLILKNVIPLICLKIDLVITQNSCVERKNDKIKMSIISKVVDFNSSSVAPNTNKPNFESDRIAHWLSAFSCIPGTISDNQIFREKLLLRSSILIQGDSKGSLEIHKQFCMINFLGKLIDHWANDPINAPAGLSNVHKTGTSENHIFSITLSIIEDIAQMWDVLHARKSYIIPTIIPGLAKLAISSYSSAETKAVCVKVIIDMSRAWERLQSKSDLSESNSSLNNFNIKNMQPLTQYLHEDNLHHSKYEEKINEERCMKNESNIIVDNLFSRVKKDFTKNEVYGRESLISMLEIVNKLLIPFSNADKQ